MTAQYLTLYFIATILLHFWSSMSSPGQRRGYCGHVMVLFDLHTKWARCREKDIGGDDCVAKKPYSILEGFTEDQKTQLATPVNTGYVKNLARRKLTLPPMLLCLRLLSWVKSRVRVRAPVIEAKHHLRKPKRPLISPP